MTEKDIGGSDGDGITEPVTLPFGQADDLAESLGFTHQPGLVLAPCVEQPAG
jgi:hypothetical protein